MCPHKPSHRIPSVAAFPRLPDLVGGVAPAETGAAGARQLVVVQIQALRMGVGDGACGGGAEGWGGGGEGGGGVGGEVRGGRGRKGRRGRGGRGKKGR